MQLGGIFRAILLYLGLILVIIAFIMVRLLYIMRSIGKGCARWDFFIFTGSLLDKNKKSNVARSTYLILG